MFGKLDVLKSMFNFNLEINMIHANYTARCIWMKRAEYITESTGKMFREVKQMFPDERNPSGKEKRDNADGPSAFSSPKDSQPIKIQNTRLDMRTVHSLQHSTINLGLFGLTVAQEPHALNRRETSGLTDAMVSFDAGLGQ